mmetsp:Transcript_23464/g.46246  ORF Transcript_23464/g.46246 Transcript_23464/m.46246 type:complete len:180 (-) Transcript_23464:187-726(-)
MLDAEMRPEKGYNPKSNLWTASSNGDFRRVTELLQGDKGFTPNSKDDNGYTPLHAAASYGHIDLLKFLIEKGGDVDTRDEDGDTPLHSCETATAVSVLLEAKADITIKNSEGEHPLAKALKEQVEDNQAGEPPNEDRKEMIAVMLEHFKAMKNSQKVQNLIAENSEEAGLGTVPESKED